MKIGCLSDAHLCAGDPPEKDVLLYATLVHLLGRCDHIVVAGDFLEMYKRLGGRRRHFKKVAAAYPRTFDLIYRYWHKFSFLEGNHDDGCLAMIPRVHPVEYLRCDGWLFFHGHQADIFFARRTIEKLSESLIKFVFRAEAWVAGRTKFRMSEWFAGHQSRNQSGVERLADYARANLENDCFLDGVVCGHTHIIHGMHMPSGGDYFNLGTYQNGDVWILDTETNALERVGGGHDGTH